ncbi:HIT domain-containing protein [Luteibacter sp. PPL201]|uniref:HIT domain-containing protein n=1 Tax=Luteibacter sahnii TaxID=3021977 RepID=A0ABT6B936_9GAMM
MLLFTSTPLSAGLVTSEQRGVRHVLVIPRNHRDAILDATDEEAADLDRLVKQMARAIDAAFHWPGIAV